MRMFLGLVSSMMLHHRQRPLLQRLRHQGVVGIAHGGDGDLPGLIPFQVLLVNEDAHQLGDRQRGVGVVELDGRMVGKLRPLLAVTFEAAHDVGERTGDEEVLLLEAQLLAHVEGVVGVEDLAEVLRRDLAAHRLGVVAVVELVEVELLGALGRPEAERVDGLAAVADDRGVVGHAVDDLAADPLEVVPSPLPDDLDLAAELHRIDDRGAHDLPGVAVAQPVVGLLDLPPRLDLLAEDAVVVADAVAVGGDLQRGQ
jgi:hypothetical protein